MSRRGDEERAAAARERAKAQREHLLAHADTEAATKARYLHDAGGEHFAARHEHGAAVHERAAATHERAAHIHDQAADLADEHEQHLAAKRGRLRAEDGDQ
jgi:hypothetical protein